MDYQVSGAVGVPYQGNDEAIIRGCLTQPTRPFLKKRQRRLERRSPNLEYSSRGGVSAEYGGSKRGYLSQPWAAGLTVPVAYTQALWNSSTLPSASTICPRWSSD